jgi:hypothetical protein
VVFNSKGIPFVCDFGTSKIIQIDPDTLAIKEYELPNPDSRPRRIAISPDDIIWYADYSRGYLGRLDPKTGKVSESASSVPELPPCLSPELKIHSQNIFCECIFLWLPGRLPCLNVPAFESIADTG